MTYPCSICHQLQQQNQSGDRTTHAHTGSTCEWCATHPTGAAAARAALDAAMTAKLEWIARADEWLKLQNAWDRVHS